MVYGIVLAGGYSSRAKQNKMMFEIDGKPLIHHTIESMINHVDELIVVTGNYHEDIFQSVKIYPTVKIVRNHHFDNGMFSSVKVGVKQVKGDVFIVPGDCPTICEDVYKTLLESSGVIRVPTYKNRKGHPIFLKQELIEPLLRFDDDSNLKVFRDSYDVTYCATNCPGILKDIDTLEDYKTLIERNEENGD